MKLVIIGFNGLVGKEFISICDKNNTEYIIIGNSQKDQMVKLENNKMLWCYGLDSFNYEDDYIFINCADKEQAIIVSNKMSKSSILIDNSSQFRLDKDIPLVIPEINMVYNKNIYANPNCSTIILGLLLYPLEKEFGIKRIVVSTYQASSGAGKVGLDELIKQTNEYCNNDELTKDYWKKQYIYNTFVHNTPINKETNYNEEEMKIINETKKIFNRDIKITSTCIRVPVIRSHCESVNIELNKKTDINTIKKLLSEYDYLEIMDDKEKQIFPESITSSNQTKVQIGHIRQDYSLDEGYGWNFWISGDQILRGASYNAWLIYKSIIMNII